MGCDQDDKKILILFFGHNSRSCMLPAGRMSRRSSPIFDIVKTIFLHTTRTFVTQKPLHIHTRTAFCNFHDFLKNYSEWNSSIKWSRGLLHFCMKIMIFWLDEQTLFRVICEFQIGENYQCVPFCFPPSIPLCDTFGAVIKSVLVKYCQFITFSPLVDTKITPIRLH